MKANETYPFDVNSLSAQSVIELLRSRDFKKLTL